MRLLTMRAWNLQTGIAAVLGLCFRLLADPKNSDSVVTTAAATVRQVGMSSSAHAVHCQL